jgi:hypothetical protein
MSPPRKASHQKNSQRVGRQLGHELLGAIRTGGRFLQTFGSDVSQLLLSPSEAIPRLGREKSWRFFSTSFVTFILIMQLWFWLAFIRFAPESFIFKPVLAHWLKQALAVWIIFPLALMFLTKAGLKLFFIQELKLRQAANLAAIAVLPLMAGFVLAGLLLILRLGSTLFTATLIFSLLVSLRYYSETLQTLHNLDRLKRIYFPPLVYAVSYLAVHVSYLTLQLLMSTNSQGFE